MSSKRLSIFFLILSNGCSFLGSGSGTAFDVVDAVDAVGVVGAVGGVAVTVAVPILSTPSTNERLRLISLLIFVGSIMYQSPIVGIGKELPMS